MIYGRNGSAVLKKYKEMEPMIKRKRSGALLLAAVVGLTVLGGCGSKEGTASPQETKVVQATQAAAMTVDDGKAQETEAGKETSARQDSGDTLRCPCFRRQ